MVSYTDLFLPCLIVFSLNISITCTSIQLAPNSYQWIKIEADCIIMVSYAYEFVISLVECHFNFILQHCLCSCTFNLVMQLGFCRLSETLIMNNNHPPTC